MKTIFSGMELSANGIEVGRVYKKNFLVLGLKEINEDVYVIYEDIKNGYRDVLMIDGFILKLASLPQV